MNFRCVKDENQLEIDLKVIKLPTNQEEEEGVSLGEQHIYDDQKKNNAIRIAHSSIVTTIEKVLQIYSDYYNSSAADYHDFEYKYHQNCITLVKKYYYYYYYCPCPVNAGSLTAIHSY